MATNPRMLTGSFRDRTTGSRIYSWLVKRGYGADEINVLMTEKTRAAFGEEHEEHEEHEVQFKAGSKFSEGMAAGGAVGTAVGATVAALAALGTSIVVPGLGWVVAGPIFAALAGGGAGALAGGAIGALIGLGISESNAAAYEEALCHGGVVIGVVPHSSEDATAIKKKFEDEHADNIVYSSQ
jgi:hypothetical protein